MGVSRKSSTLIRFSIINYPCWGTPIYGDPHMFWSAESLVFLIAIFFIKNKWEADVRCVARSTVKSDQFEVARSVCQYAIYCNSFVCSTICPMTKRDNDFPGIFAKDQRSEIWCLKDDSCERWNVRHHPSDLSQAGIGKHWTPCLDNFLFRTTWANFSLLVSMVSMVFRVGFVQNFAFPVVLPDLFWLVLYVFSSHDVADQMCQEPIALVPWVVVWPSSNRICYVLELSFEFEDVWSAAFFKCSWNRGEKRLSLAKNSQLTGEDIYWHFCMSADVFSMSLMYTYYTYIYILITYCIVLRYAFWFLSCIPWMTWLNERWRSSFLLKFRGDLFMLFFFPSLSTSF